MIYKTGNNISVGAVNRIMVHSSSGILHGCESNMYSEFLTTHEDANDVMLG